MDSWRIDPGGQRFGSGNCKDKEENGGNDCRGTQRNHTCGDNRKRIRTLSVERMDLQGAG